MAATSSFAILLIGWALALPATAESELCGLNEKARQLASLIVDDEDQQRTQLRCNALLSQVAQAKAEEMAASGEVSHEGPGGMPDQRLISAGYDLLLPTSAELANHVEAIVGGPKHPDKALDHFRNSYGHRIHLFGEHPFFLEQDEIGVGYAVNKHSPHVYYWAVYIAKQEQEP